MGIFTENSAVLSLKAAEKITFSIGVTEEQYLVNYRDDSPLINLFSGVL